MRNYTEINYKEEIDKLYSALYVISKFEEGDHLYLKRAIRKEIARLEKIDEELSKM